jgi:hypothetical protein
MRNLPCFWLKEFILDRGRTLRSFNLSDGEGQITINAGDLPDGLYIYDLQVNGRQVLERKMSVVTK